MIKKLLLILWQLAFPNFCEWCRQLLSSSEVLCLDCLKLIKPVSSCKVPVTKTKTLWVHALGAYQDPLRYFIISKGWSYQLASKQLAQLLWEYSGVSLLSFDVIVPIPLHWTRFSQRGYNQAEIIASELSRKSGRPYVNVLKRTKKTAFQFNLNIAQRAVNLNDAFVVKNEYEHFIIGKRILLVDDLLTTGSTLSQAAKKLQTCRPAEIIGVVAARVT